MARIRAVPEPNTQTTVVVPADAASLIYRDKSGRNRNDSMTEGGANLSSLVAHHAADEAARLAKEAEESK